MMESWQLVSTAKQSHLFGEGFLRPWSTVISDERPIPRAIVCVADSIDRGRFIGGARSVCAHCGGGKLNLQNKRHVQPIFISLFYNRKFNVASGVNQSLIPCKSRRVHSDQTYLNFLRRFSTAVLFCGVVAK